VHSNWITMMAGQSTNVMLIAQAATPATDAAPAAAAPAQATTAAPAQAAQAAASDANAAGATATQASVAVPNEAVGFPPFDTSTFGSQILWLVICFGILYWVVSRVALPRVGGILATRKDKVDGDLAEADKLRAQTEKAIADYEAALGAARSKAQGIAQQTRDANRAEADAKRAAVEADLAKKVAAAEASIQRAKTEALGNVDAIAADTAAALVQQLTGSVSAEEAKAAVASVVKG
jgi:F-type H+-transporting ATPase subunit b